MPPAAITAPTKMPSPLASAAVAVALEVDEREPDQPAGQAAEQDAHERDHPGARGGDRREGSWLGHPPSVLGRRADAAAGSLA